MFCLASASNNAQAGEVQRLLVPPRATDARLAESDASHLVAYNTEAADQPLLVWLPGTNGHPDTGPQKFFATALNQGYRLVGLSYLTSPGVSNVCTVRYLRSRGNCAELFRQQRVWGDGDTGLIDDRPEDAIVPRLIKLLRYLETNDPAGHWANYMKGDEPDWDRIVLAGQSQGGGMAAYLAQSRRVAGVIDFSGGWDKGRDGDIARWYHRPSATPPERWQATYHVDEPTASTMAQIYRTLGLPADHIHALQLEVMGRLAHTEGVHNPAYQPLWEEMLKRP